MAKKQEKKLGAAAATKAPKAKGTEVPALSRFEALKAKIEAPGLTVEWAARTDDHYAMLENLASQVKVRFVVPLEGKETSGKAIETCILNGVRLNILKGKYVDLPQQVAEILAESYHGTRAALNQGLAVNAKGDGKTNVSASEALGV